MNNCKCERIDYAQVLFKNFPDVIEVKDLPRMLPNVKLSKAYSLIRNKEIYSIKVGVNYAIPKIAVIEYLLGNKKSFELN